MSAKGAGDTRIALLEVEDLEKAYIAPRQTSGINKLTFSIEKNAEADASRFRPFGALDSGQRVAIIRNTTPSGSTAARPLISVRRCIPSRSENEDADAN
jgi:hypothetical protein